MTGTVLACCGGTREPVEHDPACPNIVRAAFSWIEESSVGERHRLRGLAAFEAILAERDQLRDMLTTESERTDNHG